MKYTYTLLISLFLMSCSINEKNEINHNQSEESYIGTSKFELIDKYRLDLIDNTKKRLLVGQIWYPIRDGKGKTTEYIDSVLVSYMKEVNYYSLDHKELDSLKKIETNSILNATIKNSTEKFPVVFFMHGLGVPKEFYSILIEDIVKSGYVVIALDHPYGGLTISKDREIMTSDMLESFDIENQIFEWSTDIQFTLKKFKEKDVEINDTILNILDFDKIVVGGHSLGGNVALGINEYIANVSGAFNLDGGSWEVIETKGLKIPSLIMRSHPLYSNKELEEKGRNRDSWNEMGNMIDSIHMSIYTKSSEKIIQIKVKGTGHMSYTDAPYYLPDLITRFGGEIIYKELNRNITKDFIVSFLDDLCKKEKRVNLNSYNENVLIEKFNK